MATVNVKNVKELMAALNNATGDTTIRLAPGDYDNLYLSGNKIPELSNNSNITITSQNANNPASITSMILIGAKNVTFDGITFDYTASSGASVGTRPFMFLTTDNITVQNSVFDGDLARGLSNTENGYGTGIAMGIKGSTNLTVINNTFYDFHKGTVAENSTNVVISNNDISRMASDGIGFQASKNVTIANNYIHDFASHPNTNAHKDMIQFWSAGKNTASSNVTITGNVLDSGGGTYTQSILVGTSNGTTYSDFKIEDNLIHNSFTHGITLNNIRNVVVQNNTVLHNADTAVNSSGLYVPKIHIGNQVSSATVKDNITHAVTGSKWNGSGNLIVQNTDPNQPNYYGDLFVDALAGKDATVADLAGVPGGVIEKSGVGANITQLPNTNATSSTPTTKIANTSSNTQTESYIDKTADTDGGNTTPAPASTVTKTGTAIDVDFQKGVSDQSAKSNAASSKGVTIVTDQGSKVAKLSSKSVITYKDTPDLFNNKAYTVMADFRKDHMSDSGKLITFANSFVVQVKDDMLSVSVTTNKGTKWINTKAPVDDTSWHKLALTFDSSSGKAVLYLDGAQIGSVSGLRGAVQTGNTSQDFHVGSPWGGSFDGRVDNVAFLTNDLSASEIKAIHAGKASVPTNTSSGASSDTSPGISGLSSMSSTKNAADETGADINTGGSFSYTMTAGKTKVVLDKAAKAGIIDQAYLSGDTARAFNVKVIDSKSSTHFENALGVYEVDGRGKIVDVRILDTNAQTSEGTIRVTGVDKGHDLGFFIVQDGYNRLDKVLGSKNLSLEVKSGDVYLKSGSKILTNKVFVSHDKNLNYDNHEHVASMDNPNSSGAIIGFEDQQYGGNRNDMSDVVFEVTAVGADELSFA